MSKLEIEILKMKKIEILKMKKKLSTLHRLKGILINRLNFTGEEEEEEEEVVRIVRRRRCPRFNCRRRCEFGFQKDEFGCDKCVCNAGPRVEFPEQCADRPACYRLVNCKFSIFRSLVLSPYFE